MPKRKSKPKSSHRVFSREFKVGIVRRMLAGENVSALARELKSTRKDLYIWRDRFLAGGPEALRGRGRPPKAEAASLAASGTRAKAAAETAVAEMPAAELETARTRIAELERKVGQQQVELDFFLASLAAGQGSTPAEHRAWRDGVYEVIQAMTAATLPQGELTIERMCALAGVSRAGYYRHWSASAPRQEETVVLDAIQRLALAHPHRRIAVLLRREGLAVNHKRVLRLMLEDNLLCLRKRAFVPATTDSRHGWRVLPNLVRGMVTTGLDQLWVADITFIRLQEEFAFLAIVHDAFSRRVVGWALDTHLQASLAIAALNMAIATRRPAPRSLIHHSDRGVQYACGDYAAVLEVRGIQASMSGVGNPYDNAKAESFMKTLKQDEVGGRSYRDAHQAKEMIGSFIEQVYNRHRLHSALAYQPPAEFEANLQAEGAPPTASRSLATALWGARSRAACFAKSNHQPGSAVVVQQTQIATCS